LSLGVVHCLYVSLLCPSYLLYVPDRTNISIMSHCGQPTMRIASIVLVFTLNSLIPSRSQAEGVIDVIFP
jgi:hypothetical protein